MANTTVKDVFKLLENDCRINNRRITISAENDISLDCDGGMVFGAFQDYIVDCIDYYPPDETDLCGRYSLTLKTKFIKIGDVA